MDCACVTERPGVKTELFWSKIEVFLEHSLAIVRLLLVRENLHGVRDKIGFAIARIPSRYSELEKEAQCEQNCYLEFGFTCYFDWIQIRKLLHEFCAI